MKAEMIQPFLHSACNVIEQVMQVRPERGELEMVAWDGAHDLSIQIGLSGNLNGHVAFGLNKPVAIRMASAMMGGYPLESLDMMGESAISELGNMISGNASTMLYNQGIMVDITTPQLIINDTQSHSGVNAMAVPLLLKDIGRFDILIRG
ncbi:chemotaxis protein CheX [Paenibacillus marinisediminis]